MLELIEKEEKNTGLSEFSMNCPEILAKELDNPTTEI